jgi:ubiquinone/menaquinone biosynthesis C-methylase UbiE
MPANPDRAVEIQRKYYTDTAAQYDAMHANEGATDAVLMNYICGFLRMLQARSVLDVGSATGRGTRDLKGALPEMLVCGVEPVAALAGHIIRDGCAPPVPIVRATGEALPFPNASFDAVCEFSVLHHVPNPGAVIKEMLRVARRAVFICDSNRFGQGSLMARLVKLALYKSKLWPMYTYLRTGGKGYMITEGDGLFYSYSVYDSYELIAEWADRIIPIPCAAGAATSWFHPLLTSTAVALCAIRERS